jgi:hypothetical protein
MPTEQQVLAAAGPGLDYERASQVLGIPPGQAYLVATGLPVDGSDMPRPADLHRPGVIDGSTQHLVYGKLELVNPAQKLEVQEWIRHRARHDQASVAAADSRGAGRANPAAPERPGTLGREPAAE